MQEWSQPCLDPWQQLGGIQWAWAAGLWGPIQIWWGYCLADPPAAQPGDGNTAWHHGGFSSSWKLVPGMEWQGPHSISCLLFFPGPREIHSKEKPLRGSGAGSHWCRRKSHFPVVLWAIIFALGSQQ